MKIATIEKNAYVCLYVCLLNDIVNECERFKIFLTTLKRSKSPCRLVVPSILAPRIHQQSQVLFSHALLGVGQLAVLRCLTIVDSGAPAHSFGFNCVPRTVLDGYTATQTNKAIQNSQTNASLRVPTCPSHFL